MTTTADFRQLPQAISCENDLNTPLTVFKRFQSTRQTNLLIAKLGQASVREFHLGDKLFSFLPPEPIEGPVSSHRDDQGDCFLVCEGRVRLLCQNLDSQRPVTATVLEAGDIFGADHLFCKNPLAYDAIAASSGHLVRISSQELPALLEQFPQLYANLKQMAQQRERLIFFKRFTQLHALPSHTLKSTLLPHLVEQLVQAGESLRQATPANTGLFWLRAGQVRSQANTSTPPGSGDSWGYPEPTPADWVAETDLLVYQLLLESWEETHTDVTSCNRS